MGRSHQIAQRQASDTPAATYDLYDASGRLTDVWLPAALDANPASATYNAMVCPHWQYGYDKNGNQTSQTDPDGHMTLFAYDDQGRRTGRTLPDGEQEHWTYDSRGRMLTHVDFKGQTTGYVYDDASSAGGREQAEYRFASGAAALDAAGHVQTGLAAESTQFSYDQLGRQASVDEYAAGTLSRHTGYAYDPVTGQQASVISLEGTIHYEYDPATGQHVRTYTDNNDTQYAYDPQGRLWQVTVTMLNGQNLFSSPLVTTYGYDAVGNLVDTVQTQGSSTITGTRYAYDDLNRLTDEIVTSGTSTPVFSQHYDLRSDGLRSDDIETRYDGSGNVFSKIRFDWTYDGDDRLTSEAETVIVAGSNTPSPYANHFAFDLAGNRVRQTIDDGNDSVIDATVSYTYNGDDQLLTETRTGTNSYQTSDTYDANGSLIAKHRAAGSEQQDDLYTWDLRNRLIATDIGGNSLTLYGYDSNGVLVSQTANAGTTQQATTYYVNDLENPTGYSKAIEERTGASAATAAVSRSYVLGLKVEAQSDATNGTLFLTTDGHGSTRALLDTTGNIVQTFDYAAFGDLIGGATAKTTWLFAGDGQSHPLSDLTYHLARWRNGFNFISEDGLGYGNLRDPISLHSYLYANANPLMLWDRNGHTSTLETEAVTAQQTTLMSLVPRISGIVMRRVTYTFLSLPWYYMRFLTILPRLSFYATVASLVLDTGVSFLDDATKRWSNAPNLPSDNFLRGKILGRLAGQNLADNFPGIDDFRDGFATSIKSHGCSTVEQYLSALRKDLQDLKEATSQELRGYDAAQIKRTIMPADIQAKALLVAVPEADMSLLGEWEVLQEIRALAEQARAIVRIVPIPGKK